MLLDLGLFLGVKLETQYGSKKKLMTFKEFLEIKKNLKFKI